MSALPLLEAPPPDTPDSHGPNPYAGTIREPRRVPVGPPVSTTVRLCLVDPTADTDEIITAAVSMITTAYTEPGDQIMLANTGTTTTARRQRRDQLVDSVLRLGRGVTTAPDRPARSDHHPSPARGGLPGASGAGSGLGPRRGDMTEPVATATERQSLSKSTSPVSDAFALIIAGWSGHPVATPSMSDWARALAPNGTVVTLTHRSGQRPVRLTHSGRLVRAAAAAGLILTDRLILAYQLPSAPRPATCQSRRAIALHGHHRVHTAACVFHRSTRSAEVGYA